MDADWRLETKHSSIFNLAELKIITDKEWLPALLGSNAIRNYRGFNRGKFSPVKVESGIPRHCSPSPLAFAALMIFPASDTCTSIAFLVSAVSNCTS